MLKILFVCTGNTCRSPMAEYLCKAELSKTELTFEVDASSAGLAAVPGEKASELSEQLLKAEGINPDRHHASVVDRDMVEDSDLILVMTADQLRQLSVRFPYAARKMFLFKEFAGHSAGEPDIKDPIGSDLQTYRIVLEDIRCCIKKIINKFREAPDDENSPG